MKTTAQTPALQEIARESSRLLSQFSPIVLSNRAPIQPMPDGRYAPGAGGLVKALTSLATAVKASWVAAARTQSERELAARGASIPSDGESDDSFPISFAPTDEEAYALHYAVVSNPLLWFAHHYLWNIATEPIVDKAIYRAWFEGYCKVNASVADHAVSVARALPNRPLFLTQDYQLYLAPEAIRAALPEAVMQQFIHVPWPEPRYFKVLPAAMREPIFRGMLANDVVGLQTSLDVHNFLRCCAELMGLRVVEPDSVVLYGGRLVWVRAYPVSIDVDALKQLGESQTVTDINADVESWRPQKLIVRVDRTDPAKNLVRGFLAYERLLEDHPEHHGRVGMWAFLQPSRQDVDAYRSYDVLLVNPILDGMNLVAKEGPIVNQRAGVLILSESAGAHEELGAHALSINPFDVEVTAKALHRALQMSQAERSERSIAINQVVAANDVARWIRHQLEDIRSLAPPQRAHSHVVAAIPIPE